MQSSRVIAARVCRATRVPGNRVALPARVSSATARMSGRPCLRGAGGRRVCQQAGRSFLARPLSTHTPRPRRAQPQARARSGDPHTIHDLAVSTPSLE
eukprot:3639871-Prymnesium_polylepis.1